MNRGELKEEVSLIKRFQSGEPEVFNTLVLHYNQAIFGLCFKFLHSSEDANDCAQESFIKAYKGLSKFNLQSRFSTWLYRITVNTCLNRLGSVSRKKEVAIDESQNIAGSTKEHPDTIIENKHIQKHIKLCMEKLLEEHKAVVVLRDVEGLSYEDVAQVLGKTLGTVKSRLARARGKLRVCLEGVL